MSLVLDVTRIDATLGATQDQFNIPQMERAVPDCGRANAIILKHNIS